MSKDASPHFWLERDGKPISCKEKLKVLEENLAEIRTLASEAFEDAVLMGCDPEQFRRALHFMVDYLETPYHR